jgi:5'-methylthioadenosine phosphorylase
MVTDYDCWHEEHDAVEVTDILKVLTDNADHARALVKRVLPMLHESDAECAQTCDRVLETSIVTAPDAWDPAMLDKLDAVAGRLRS